MCIVLSYSSYFMLFYIPIFTTHVSAFPTNPTPVLLLLLWTSILSPMPFIVLYIHI